MTSGRATPGRRLSVIRLPPSLSRMASGTGPPTCPPPCPNPPPPRGEGPMPRLVHLDERRFEARGTGGGVLLPPRGGSGIEGRGGRSDQRRKVEREKPMA